MYRQMAIRKGGYMYITVITETEMNFMDLIQNCWSGAIDTLEYIKEHDKEEELLYLIEELDLHDMTEINDFLWFDDEYIYECLGITEEDKEEE